jgi:hypothetical protein
VRSDAKASSAASTSGRGRSLGSLHGGAFATRGASLCADGSGAPSAGRPLAVSLGLLLAALLSLVPMASTALAAAPTIPVTTVSAVTTKAAVLEANVNPEGEATTYQFQYGLADCSSNPCASVPAVAAGIGSGSEAVRVSKGILGLEPGATYHFRVVATNGSGTTNGPDRAFTTHLPFVVETDCPNQPFRWGASASLPDCRAYEMVSPVDKAGHEAEVLRLGGHMQSSLDGNRFTYTSSGVFGDAASAKLHNQYIATRTASGWLTHGIDPAQGTTISDPDFSITELERRFEAFTPDLSSGWLRDFNKTPLAAGAREGFENFYRRDNLDDSYEAVSTAAPVMGEASYRMFVGNFSDDGSRIFLMVARPLTADAAMHTKEDFQIYEYSAGQLELVSILPGGEAHSGESWVGTLDDGSGASFINILQTRTADNGISADGSRVFWTASDASSPTPIPGHVYVRVDGQVTVPVSEAITADASRFWTASDDGSKALFSVEEGPLAGNLYEFDVDKAFQSEPATTFIAGEAGGRAGEPGGVLGAADDLSYVYFVSRQALAAGATAGERNLYVRHEGANEFIAAVEPGESAFNIAHDAPRLHRSRVTPDGRRLVFASTRSLTGYDNSDAVTGEPLSELYRYDADTEDLSCVSCNPSGAQPVGIVPDAPFREDTFAGVPRSAAWLTPWQSSVNELHPVADDGNRLFFNAFDPLVPHDSNGVEDVYQWEAPGTGRCKVGGTGYSAQNDGCISLISTGQSPDKSLFVDASQDGETVFFRTKSSIDPQDPGLVDIYAARAGGGYPQPPSPSPCVGDACQVIPPPPNDPTPASASFRGAGDPAPPKARRRCRTPRRKAGKASAQAKRKASRCRRANRRAAR